MVDRSNTPLILVCIDKTMGLQFSFNARSLPFFSIKVITACQLFQHDGVQQESSFYFGHRTQMNLMSFS